ncbi:50S ribosomal protein L1 [Patescibacteria group bacterium]
MGSSKIKAVDMSIQPDEKVDAKKTKSDVKTEDKKDVVKKKKSKERSKNYINKRGMVDRTKFYSLKEAVELVQKTSYSKFAGTINADLILKDEKAQIDISFPHSTGKTKKVVIVSDKIIKDIDAGKIEFDILLATPEFMPKIAKYARVLGPKGLMPNPKLGTVTKDPEKKKKDLEGGKITLRTEKKAPLMHVVVGKTDMKTDQLIENITLLINKINARKIQKLVLSATMSPGVKVDFSEFVKS